MREDRLAEALAARAPGAGAEVRPEQRADLTEEERSELESLVWLASRLDARMEPIRPSHAFVESLGEELVEAAERRRAEQKRRHRIAVVSAAVAGAVVSIASVVGGIVVLVRWLRTRTDARQASAA